MRVLPLILAAGFGLIPAQAASPRWSVGFGFHIDQPMADLNKDTDNQPGLGFSFYIPMDFGGGHVLRPRWESTRHNLRTHGNGVIRVENGHIFLPDATRGVTLESHGFGADYLYYPGGKTRRGVYFLAGVGVDFWERDKDDNHMVTLVVAQPGGDQVVARDHIIQRSSGLTTQLGVGMQLSRGTAVEVKIRSSQYRLADVALRSDTEAYFTSKTRQAVMGQVGLVFKF